MDDITTRLRVLNHHAKKLAENESLHALHRDAFTRCEELTWKAAEEIMQLRQQVKELQAKVFSLSMDSIQRLDDEIANKR